MAWSDEIPAILAAHPGWTDAQVATAINEMTVQQPCVIPSKSMMEWLASNGRYQRLQDLADDATKDVNVRSVAKVALIMLGRSDTEVDPNDPVHAAMIGALVTEGVCTAAEAQELAGLAVTTVPKYPGGVTPFQVQLARGR